MTDKDSEAEEKLFQIARFGWTTNSNCPAISEAKFQNSWPLAAWTSRSSITKRRATVRLMMKEHSSSTSQIKFSKKYVMLLCSYIREYVVVRSRQRTGIHTTVLKCGCRKRLVTSSTSSPTRLHKFIWRDYWFDWFILDCTFDFFALVTNFN
jgi:hypothetical protein